MRVMSAAASFGSSGSSAIPAPARTAPRRVKTWPGSEGIPPPLAHLAVAAARHATACVGLTLCQPMHGSTRTRAKSSEKHRILSLLKRDISRTVASATVVTTPCAILALRSKAGSGSDEYWRRPDGLGGGVGAEDATRRRDALQPRVSGCVPSAGCLTMGGGHASTSQSSWSVDTSAGDNPGTVGWASGSRVPAAAVGGY